MVDEVKRPKESEDKFAEFDEWFEDTEEESVDDEPEYDEEISAESDEEVDVPEEEVPDESPERADSEGAQHEAEPEEDPYSWVSELNPEFQKKVESLVNATKSQAGRAAAEARQKMELQAQLDRTRAQLEARNSVSAKSTPSKAVPTSEQIADMDDEELKDFVKDYPHVAKSVEKMMDRRDRQTKEEVLSQIRPIQEEAEAQRSYERRQALRREAEHIFNTAETGIDLDTVLQSDRWKEWVDQQSPGYRKYINNANDVADAAKVLEDFATYANQVVYQQWQSQQEQRTQEETSHADETVARRKSAQQGTHPKSKSAQLSDRGRGAAYEDYWEQFASSE